jgi:hypothetical protein
MLEKKIRLILNWRPNSPDLSVTENVWGILKLRIAARGPKTVEKFTKIPQEEWDNLKMSVINGLFLSMRYQFEMCLKLEGKCIGHLVRNNAHRGEAEEETDLPDPVRGFAIHQLKAKHVETTVTVHRCVIDIRPARVNGSLIWVGLEDNLACPKKGYCRRVGMMAQVEDAPLFSKGQVLVMSIEVHAAHRQFTGDPAIEKYVLKPLKWYLPFVAMQNVEDGEEQPPTLNDFDGPEIEADDG